MAELDNDILPALLKAIQDDFALGVADSQVIAQEIENLALAKATYTNANQYAIELGEILARVLGKHVTGDVLPDGKMYYNIASRLLEPVLKRNYELISEYAGQVQDNLNAEAGLRLQVAKMTLNQDRIDGLVNRLASEDDFDAVKWLLGDPIVNFSQSVVDDSIRVNAESHLAKGLRPKIVRRLAGKPCKWCTSLAGTYEYDEAPRDIYRRHENCRCTVDYRTADGKSRDVWSKRVTKSSRNSRVMDRENALNTREKGRQVDAIEWRRAMRLLGAENVPKTLDAFQNLKYDDVVGYADLQRRLNQSTN